MNYLLDTNIIIIYSKGGRLVEQIEKEYNILSNNNSLAVSIVTIAEINSIAHQVQLGARRRKYLDQLLERVYHININVVEILKKYEEIDAYSQGKHQNLYSPFSSRNMGKNDIWIAATASALKVPLVTTDKDFEHLNKVFIDLVLIDLKKYK